MKRLFRYYGFEAGPMEAKILGLRKGSLTVDIVMVEGSPETDDVQLGKLLDNESKADRVIVASLGRFTEQARLLAQKRKVQLWDRTHIEDEVGRMVVGEADTRAAAAADESLLEPFLSAEDAKTDMGTISDVEAPGTQPDIPDGEAMVRPEITMEQVRSLVKDRLEGAFRFDLQLLPHYVLSYSLELEGPAGSKMMRTGGVQVNAINGEACEWRQGMTLEKPEPGRMRIEPSLERAQATVKALDLVLSLHTRVVNVRQEKRSVTVYEKRTIRPREDAVMLEHRGMLYLPVWCVEASDGAAVLDAVSGRMIKEERFDARAATSSGEPCV